MEKRTLIALALSFMVLGFYPLVLQKFYPDYYKKRAAVTSSAKTSTTASGPHASEKLIKAGSFLPDDDLSFQNPSLSVLFNKKDGSIREIDFPRFINSETSRPIQLLSLKEAGLSPASLVVTSGDDTSLVTDFTGDPASGLSASALGGKLGVTKTFLLKDDYSGNLKLRLENTSDQPLELSYELVIGSGLIPRHSIDQQYIEANFFFEKDGKKTLKHHKENRVGKHVESGVPLKWAAVKDRHFSVIFKPESGSFTGLERGLGARNFSASLVSEKLTIAPHASLDQAFTLYIGPNELENLEPLGLDDLINFGKFDPIGRLFVGALELLHKLCKNYGVSIIVLTAMINLLLFPLTRVSYMSMKRMQLIQPQMNKLKEKYKKDSEKLNKEMMELYKKHKVNPFGGCLPMVIQIPIFISLYVALSKSVILINSHFLWMKDLSSPDRVYLPLTLPFLGNSIHLLPLLMVAMMVIQQKFTQIKMSGQDPAMEAQQKMMATTMPIVFGFIFYQMPSGLVLYWLTNTLITLTYQLRLKNMTLTT